MSLNVKQPSFKADFKQFIFSQPFKLFYSEAEDDGLFKPGQKPLKIIWCMEICVTEIEKREIETERENRSSSLVSVNKTQPSLFEISFSVQ